MAQTVKISDVVKWARTVPNLVPLLGVSGFELEPAMTIAAQVQAEIYAAPWNWKWNRSVAPTFYVNANQQDYCTTLTSVGWLESASRTDLQTAGPNTPAEIWPVEAVQGLYPTTLRGMPLKVCWIPNSQAQAGKWSAGASYTNPSTLKTVSNNPLTQILDSNGNIQIITGYGTTGTTEPVWSTTIGATTIDGTVTWTMVDPTGIAWRLDRLMGEQENGQALSVTYQQKAPAYVNLSSLIGVPDEVAYVWRQGFFALMLRHAADGRYVSEYEIFEAYIQKAMGAADREPQSMQLVPDCALGGSGWSSWGWGVW